MAETTDTGTVRDVALGLADSDLVVRGLYGTEPYCAICELQEGDLDLIDGRLVHEECAQRVRNRGHERRRRRPSRRTVQTHHEPEPDAPPAGAVPEPAAPDF